MKARRKKKSAVARVKPFWILIVVLLVSATVAGYYGAGWSGFRVREISVSGNVIVPKADVLARAAIDPSKNIWLQNTSASAARIRAIPYVEDARIHRTLPAKVNIAITERKPYALVRGGQRTILIDEHLRVLQLGANGSGLPVFNVRPPALAAGQFVRDAKVSTMARDFHVLQSAHVVPKSLSIDRLGDLSAVIAQGIVVQLGDDSNLAQKAALVDPILSQTQAQGRRIRAVDLRAPKTPVVVFRDSVSP